MTTLLLLLLAVAAAVAHRRQSRRLDALERLVTRLTAGEQPIAVAVPKPEPITAPIEMVAASPVPATPRLETDSEPRPAPPAPPPAAAPPRASASMVFEQLVGGRLPIWVGGAALAVAGYFLVGLAIESGFVTPAVRVLLASLFGFALIAAGEGAVRLRRIAEDVRVGQALSGAGIATLYAAVFLAGAHYRLIGAVPAFLMLAAITVAALLLSFRRGAPVALMALVGGFATPLLAGAHGQAVLPLIAYLALLSAGLFGLAAARGWLWLALTAAAGSLVWSGVLIATAGPGDALAAGGLALLLAIAAPLSVAASGGVRARAVLRALPLAAGAAELALLIATSGFGAGAWALYLLLSAATIFLGWRDAKLAPGVAAALAVAAFALAGTALAGGETVALVAAAGTALLFGGAGHALGRRTGDGAWWAAIGAGGLIMPYLALWTARPELLGDAGWSLLALLLALPPLHLAWRSRLAARAAPPFDPALQIAAATAAAFLAATLAGLAPPLLLPAAVLAACLGLAAAAARIGDGGLLRLALTGIAVAALLWLELEAPLRGFARLLATLPPARIDVALEALLLPALLLGAIAWRSRAAQIRDPLTIAAAVLATAAIASLVTPGWRPLVVAAAVLGAVEAVRRALAPRALLAVGTVAAVLWMLAICGGVVVALVASLGGARLLLAMLPAPVDAVRAALVPGLLLGTAAWRARALVLPWRGMLTGAATAALAAGVYVFWKQLFAVRDPAGFVAAGFAERALLTQALFAAGWWLARRGDPRLGPALTALAAFRLLWFDLIVCDPAFVGQMVGPWPVANLLTLHFAAALLWTEQAWRGTAPGRRRTLALAALVATAIGGTLLTVRQAFHGSLLASGAVGRPEFYGYSAAGVLLAVALFGRGAQLRDRPLRIAGLALLTAMVLKVFLVDAAALGGLLRVASFLGLGVTLIAIGWAYGRLTGHAEAAAAG